MINIDKTRAQRGQISVEFVIVLPVILIFLALVVDCMSFMSECARFDQVAAQTILARGVSPGVGSYSGKARLKLIKKTLTQKFKGHNESITVSTQEGASWGSSAQLVFICELKIPPWPIKTSSASIFGVEIPCALRHVYALSVDPYTPGEL